RCSNAPLTNCPADLRSGNDCLSPCTRYNTDQFCCRGAFGTAQTCVVSQWSASGQAYVNNIHSACPAEYAYPYDDTVGLHTCPTGSSYRITFCRGGGPPPPRPPPPPPPPPPGGISTTAWYTVVNQGNGKCVDDNAWGTTNGSTIIQWPCGNQQ